MTNDKYNYFHGKMKDLDEWIEKHQDIFKMNLKRILRHL